MRVFYFVVYQIILLILEIYYLFFTNYKFKWYLSKSKPYLVLNNHNSDVDFFFVSVTLIRHMFFVASEHIFRNKVTGKIVKFFVNPIPRKKAADASETVAAIKARLKEGYNVSMNVEGNRSYSGETGWISPNNGPLVKESGAGLITFVTHGGYLKSPRWAKYTRRGKTWGEVVHEYLPEELAAMSNEEVTEAIRRDIFVSAYEDQRKHMYKYKGKALAENLETALFLCPECGKYETMQSRGDEFFCTCCGMKLRYNEYGFFEKVVCKGEEPVFDNVTDWFHFQKDELEACIARHRGSEEVIFSDEAKTLCEPVPNTSPKPILTGRMSLTGKALSIEGPEGEITFPVENIERISVIKQCTLLFTANGVYYQVNTAEPYSALKYLMAVRFLKGQKYV